jgi:hypothetical protein
MAKKSSPTPLIYRVREGKQCVHNGQVFKEGEVFIPFEDLSFELQQLHVPNLVGEPEGIPPNPPSKGGSLTPEVIVEVIDQENEDPQAYNDVLL